MIDLKDDRGSTLLMKAGPRPRRWDLATIAITEAERKALEAHTGLRDFSPRLEWFAAVPPPDAGSVLVLHWANGSRAFALPPSCMRVNLPASAKRHYKEMDIIVDRVLDVRSRCLDAGAHTLMHESDARVKAYAKDYKAALHQSLPRKRIGW